MKSKRFEQGQALVLIVLSVVAIFGFAALAVDMGRVYAERRRAQSAADSAALASAYEAARTKFANDAEKYAALESTARASAYENGYDGVTNNEVIVNSPPDHGEYEECECQYVQVKIISIVQPIFLQFIGWGNQEITTEAIARGRKSQSISYGNAIHALIENNEDGDGVEVDGNITLDIKHGNIQSNKNVVDKGNSGSVTVEKGSVVYATDMEDKHGVFSAKSAYKDSALHVPVPTPPDCANAPDGQITNVDKKTTEYTAGKYDGLTMGPGVHKMGKGMYCFNGDFKIGANAVVESDDDGILIVMQKGSLDIAGNASVHWKRPNDLTDNAGNQWGGLLIFVLPGNSDPVNLTGTSDSYFIGTVFAPKAMCEFGGNGMSEVSTSSQLVCKQVRLHGDTTIRIDYRENQMYRMPPIVELIN